MPIACRLTHPFLALRRKPHRSVSVIPTPQPVLLPRLLLAAPSAAWLRRRRDDVGNAGVLHLLIQRGQLLLGAFLDLRRSIDDQRRQLRQCFLLLCVVSSPQPRQGILP